MLIWIGAVVVLTVEACTGNKTIALLLLEYCPVDPSRFTAEEMFNTGASGERNKRKATLSRFQTVSSKQAQATRTRSENT